MLTGKISATRSAIAFTRAFIAGDGKGCSEVLATTEVLELPDFVASMALLTMNALDVGNTPEPEFMEAMLALIEKTEGQKND